jgi:hypothetical protein
MDPFERKLRDALQSEPHVSFSRELQNQILRKAKQQARIKRTLRFAFSGISVLAAATLSLALLLLPDVPSDKSQTQTSLTGKTPNQANPAASLMINDSARKPAQFPKSTRSDSLNWTIAPIDVQNISTDGRTVYAKIKNTGSLPVTNHEIQGILYFSEHPGGGSEGDTWFYFVDGPNRQVKPGDSIEWEFRPVSVPSATGKINRIPQLIFVYRSASDFGPLSANHDAGSNIKWEAVPVGQKIKSVTATGNQQQYIDVELEVTNRNRTSIDLTRTMAMVFFPKDETDDNMDPFTYKYFVDLTPESETELLAGKSTVAHIRLIGPPDVDLSKRPIRLQVVQDHMVIKQATK